MSEENQNMQEKENVENVQPTTEQVTSNEVVDTNEVETITEETVTVVESTPTESSVENTNIVQAMDTENEKVTIETDVTTTTSETPPIQDVDYTKLSQEELVDALENLTATYAITEIKTPVAAIRDAFNDSFNEELAKQKEAFMAEEGAVEMDFYYESATKKNFNKLYGAYRKAQKAHYEKIKNNQENNLKLREAIVEELKALFNNGKSVRNNYSNFREIQERWNEIGNIPRDKYNTVWNNYKYHRDNFYKLMDLDRETRDLDHKLNLDKKLKIILRAQELTKEENILKAFRELQMLHKVWKDETGPVSREYSDKIWDEFSEVTKVIHDKRQAQIAEEEKQYEANYDIKKTHIDAIIAITEKGAETHKSWQNAMQEVQKEREAFIATGRVVKAKDKEIWDAFKEATKAFNKAKNDFYKGQKSEQYENLEKKKALIAIAHENKDSEDIQGTMNLMKKIQSDWKKIGHVPRKDSDTIWNEFRGACNHFFDRINAKKHKASKEEEANLEAKETVLDGLKQVTLSGEHKTDITTIKEQINAWKVIGRVPYKNKDIEATFNKAIDGLFNQLDMDKKEAALIKFENKISSLLSQEDTRAIHKEEFFLTKKIEEIRNEKLQLQNNLEFFKHVKEDNPLVKDVHKNIAKHEEELGIWKSKLSKIRSMRKAQEAAKNAANESEANSQDETESQE